MSALKDTFLIAKHETVMALTSRRVLVLVTLFVLFSALVLLIASGVASKVEEQALAQLSARGQGDEMLGALRSQVHRPLLQTLFGIDNARFLETAERWPLVSLILLKATWFFLPLYIAVMGFDQLSAEVSSRSVRYLLIRTRRFSVLFGKWFAQLSVLFLILLLVGLGTAGYLAWRTDEWGLGELLALELRFVGLSIIFSLVYTALTALCSSLSRSSAVCLVLNLVLLFVAWFLETLGSFASPDSVFHLLAYLTPWHYPSGLLHVEALPLLSAVGAHLAFTAVALGLSGLALTREDL